MAARKPKQQQPKKVEQPKRESAGKGKLKRIGALWLGYGKNGRFMSGRIEIEDGNELRILVFKNGYKEKDNQADYLIYEPSQTRGSKRDEITDDDIPF